MKYAIDTIVDNIVILENIETKEKKEIDIKFLPLNIKEGSIVKECISYSLDEEEEKRRRTIIQDKLNRLKGLKRDE